MGEVTFRWCRRRGDATWLQYFTTLLHYELPVVSYKPCALLHPSFMSQSCLCLYPLPRSFFIKLLFQHLVVLNLPWLSSKELAVAVLEIGSNFPPCYLFPFKSSTGLCILTFGGKCWAYKFSKRVLTVVVLFPVFNIPLFEKEYASFLTWRLSIISPCCLTVFHLQVVWFSGNQECFLTANSTFSNSLPWSFLYDASVNLFCKVWNFGNFCVIGRTKVGLCNTLYIGLSLSISCLSTNSTTMERSHTRKHTLPQVESSSISRLRLSVFVDSVILCYLWFISSHLRLLMLVMGSYKPP